MIDAVSGVSTDLAQSQHLKVDQSRKRKITFSRPNKQRRFEGRTNKPREVEYQKVALPKSLYISPRQQYHPIYTSSNGIPLLTEYVWKALQARVKSVNEVISKELLAYVVSIVWYARLVWVNQQAGTRTLLRGSNELRKVTSGIRLPSILCRYVESLGVYQMSNGATVIPFVDEYDALCELGTEFQFDPRESFEVMHRPVPDNPWRIDPALISHYCVTAVSKLSRTGVILEEVSVEKIGRQELIIGFSSDIIGTQDGTIRPMAPERHSEATAEIGAAFSFRDYSVVNDWPYGDNQLLHPLFEGERMSRETIIASNITSSLMMQQ